MLAKIYSATVNGVDAYEVEIEVNIGPGKPVMVIVGLPDVAVKESRDRVWTAIANSGYRPSRKRTTVNLAPADIKKEGPSFDLPIALGMIAVAEELNTSAFEKFSFVGELALDGSVRPVKGVLPVALEARRRGKHALFVPAANALEAAMVNKIDVYGVQNLRQTFQFLRGELPLLTTRGDLSGFFATHQTYDVDFADVKGQAHVKRAVEVAVARAPTIESSRFRERSPIWMRTSRSAQNTSAKRFNIALRSHAVDLSGFCEKLNPRSRLVASKIVGT